MKFQTVLLCLAMIIMTFAKANAQDEEKKWSSTPFEIKTVEAQKALVMKADVPMSDISTKMGEIYQATFSYVMENNIQPAGPAIAIYNSWDPEGNIVFEAGVPVASKAEGKGDIILKEYPEMKVLTTLYTGSYENMEPVYNKLMQYVKDEELEWTGVTWEVYLTDPQAVKDPAMNKTIIYFCLK